MRFDFPWHTEECDREFNREDTPKMPRIGRHHWCKTHGQWCTELPESITIEVHWADGSSTVVHQDQ